MKREVFGLKARGRCCQLEARKRLFPGRQNTRIGNTEFCVRKGLSHLVLKRETRVAKWLAVW